MSEESAIVPDDPGPTVARIAELVAAHPWVFAKSMPDNPHEYSVRKAWAVEADFVWVVEAIRRLGYRLKHNRSWYVVLAVGPHIYWTMGSPIRSTFLINRRRRTEGE
jgi:hypothetical protein